MQSIFTGIKKYGSMIFRLIRNFANYFFPKVKTILFKTINWWKTSYQKQSKTGRLILIGLSLVVMCCICSVPIAIFTPENPTLTPASPDGKQYESAKALQTQVAQLVITQNALLTAAIPVVLPTIDNSTKTPTPNPIVLSTQSNSSIVSGPIQVTFVDVGQGDSILIKSPEGKYCLIDGGEEGSGALEYLQVHGVTSLDLVIASHPHSDHIGGLISILKNIPTARIITNGQINSTGIYERFLDSALATKAEYSEVKRGDLISLGNLKFDVLNPGTIVGEDLNVNSIVLRLVYGETSFLFMGDANNISDEDILASGVPINSTILKIGHHASASSLSPNFITTVHPEVAIYSAGIGNDYDFPAPNTIDSITANGAKVFGTDSSGTIVITTDGSTYSIQKEKESIPTKSPNTVAIGPSVEEIAISVTNVSNPIQAGSNAALTIKSTPNSNCTITVIYKNGPSDAAGLGPQVADQNGQVSWHWKVGPGTTAGIWNIITSCKIDDKSSSLTIPFEVYK
jgi:competence protein ComEC